MSAPELTKTDLPEPRRGTPEEIGEKPWWQSISIWGGLISIFAPLAAAITNHTIESADVSDLSISAAGLAAAIGGILAVIGRIRARGVIIPNVLPK